MVLPAGFRGEETSEKTSWQQISTMKVQDSQNETVRFN